MAASVLRQLSDEDLELIHHMIRRDAHTDLEIGKRAGEMLGRSIAKGDGAVKMVVSRYRKSSAYKDWLKLYLTQSAEQEARINEIRTKYEILADIVKDENDGNYEGVSKVIRSRLLTMAIEADDSELKAAAGAKGWVNSILKLTREVQQDRYKKQVEELKEQLRLLSTKDKDGGHGVDMDEVINRVDDIMGLN